MAPSPEAAPPTSSIRSGDFCPPPSASEPTVRQQSIRGHRVVLRFEPGRRGTDGCEGHRSPRRDDAGSVPPFSLDLAGGERSRPADSTTEDLYERPRRTG